MEIIILCMSEEKLKRIEQIKQDWADEVRKIDSDSEVKGLGQKKYNKPYKDLEKKYLVQNIYSMADNCDLLLDF